MSHEEELLKRRQMKIDASIYSTPTAAPLASPKMSHAERHEAHRDAILTHAATKDLQTFTGSQKNKRLAQDTALQAILMKPVNESKYAEAAEFKELFDLSLLSDEVRAGFFESAYFKQNYEPLLALYGRGITRVVTMPVPALLDDDEIHAAISVHPSSLVFPELFSDFTEGVTVFHISCVRDSAAPVTRELCEGKKDDLAQRVNGGNDFEKPHYHVGIYRGRIRLDNPLESHFIVVSAGQPAKMAALLDQMKQSRAKPDGPVLWDSSTSQFSKSGTPMTMREFVSAGLDSKLAKEGAIYRRTLAKQVADILNVDIKEFCDVKHNYLAVKALAGDREEKRVVYYKNCISAECVHNGFPFNLSPLHGYVLVQGAPVDQYAVKFQSFGGPFSNVFQSALPHSAGRTVAVAKIRELTRDDFVKSYRTPQIKGFALTAGMNASIASRVDPTAATHLLRNVILIGQAPSAGVSSSDLLPTIFGAPPSVDSAYELLVSKLVPHDVRPVVLSPEFVIVSTPAGAAPKAKKAATKAPSSDRKRTVDIDLDAEREKIRQEYEVKFARDLAEITRSLERSVTKPAAAPVAIAATAPSTDITTTTTVPPPSDVSQPLPQVSTSAEASLSVGDYVFG